MNAQAIFPILSEAIKSQLSSGGSLNAILEACIEGWLDGRHQSFDDAQKVFSQLVETDVCDYQIGEFLVRATPDFLTEDEIAGFAQVLRDKARHVSLGASRFEIIGDTCGTGGDTMETFNISTTIMFLLAAQGIAIAKHGNRAITSQCGSADVLAALGVNVELPPEDVARCINETGVGFMFAPAYHPTTKRVQHIRKILASEMPSAVRFKTVFNVLGPLANPAGVTRQMMGIYDDSLILKLATVFERLRLDRAIVVHGIDESGQNDKGLDEVSTLGPTHVAELRKGSICECIIEPSDMGLPTARPDDLKGGDVEENARILRGILDGTIKGPKREIVLANAAVGLYLGDDNNSRSMKECLRDYVQKAARLIDEGRALEKLETMIRRTQELGRGL